MSSWLVPPVVIPIALLVLVAAYDALRAWSWKGLGVRQRLSRRSDRQIALPLPRPEAGSTGGKLGWRSMRPSWPGRPCLSASLCWPACSR